MRALEENQVLILSADPGSGKTTHVPPFLYDFEALSLSRLRRMANEIIAGTIRQSDIFPQPPSVACTQPRRFAVTSVHERVSEKFGSDEEGVVGYRMRGERSAPPAYRHRPAIEYMTDGILRFYISKGMKDFDAVMIDEVKLSLSPTHMPSLFLTSKFIFFLSPIACRCTNATSTSM